MTMKDRDEKLNVLREQLSWLLAQIEKYESGTAYSWAENAIYATHKSAEIAAKYRLRADAMATLIAAYEEA